MEFCVHGVLIMEFCVLSEECVLSWNSVFCLKNPTIPCFVSFFGVPFSLLLFFFRRSKEPYILSKESPRSEAIDVYILSKEPYIWRSKEPYFLSTEPCFLFTEPYFLSKELFNLSKKSYI